MHARYAREPSDLLRSVGGLLFAAGAVVVLFRSAHAAHWTEFERVLVISVPVVLLYALAVGRRSASEATGPPEQAAPWRSVLLVTAIVISPFALIATLRWLGVNTSRPLVEAAIFLATALLAGIGGRRARSPYGLLLAALAMIASWLFLWSKIISHPSAGDYRWLLLAAGLLLFGAAFALAQSRLSGVGELATAGGIAAVAAGSIGVVVGFGGLFFNGLLSGASGVSESETCESTSTGVEHCFHSGPPASHPSPLHDALVHTSGLQNFGWDLFLLVLSVLLIWAGSRIAARGLGYVGGLGLLVFVLSVGEQVTKLETGHTGSHALVGWPLVLVLVGLLALLAPMAGPRRGRASG